MKRLTLSIFCTSSWLLCGIAHATSLGEISEAAQRTSDKSREALTSIYGNIVNNPLATGGSGEGDTILANIFQVTNSALLVIGALFACYIMFRKLTQTAHDGAVFDRDKHTLWSPIRLVWGLSALVPTANGWSLAQLLMLWAASVMGVGIANMGVDAATHAFKEGKGMVLQPTMPSTNILAHKVFEIELCRHGINASLAQGEHNGALIHHGGYVQTEATDSGFFLSNQSFNCGGANINTDFEPQATSTNWFSPSIDVSDIRKAHLTALSTMQKSLSDAALQFVNAVMARSISGQEMLPDAEIAIRAAAQHYENVINTTAATKQGNIEELSQQLSQSINESGWWTLGAWYQTFAAANTKLSDSVAGKATTFGPSISGDPGMTNVYQTALQAYLAQQGNTAGTHASPLGATQQDDGSNIIAKLFSAPGQTLTNALININVGAESRGQVNPLLKMKNLGDHLTGIAEISFAGYLTAKGLERASESLSVAGLASRVVDLTGAVSFLKGALEGATPIILMIIIV